MGWDIESPDLSSSQYASLSDLRDRSISAEQNMQLENHQSIEKIVSSLGLPTNP